MQRDCEMLNIQSYEILDFNSDNLVVSKKGVSKISSPPLLAALNKLKSYKNISRGELNEVLSTHGLNPEPAFDFLEKIISIKDACEDLYFDKTIVAHDWDENINLEELLRSEINTPLEVCSISGLVRDQTLNKKYYIVIMCRNYDYELIKKIYFELADVAPESAISVCYSVGDAYCISQPYCPKIGNPCHFCNIDRLINYEEYHSARNAWSKLLRYCKNKHMAVPVNSLSLLQQSLVVGAVIRKIKLLTSSDNEFRYQDNILQDSHIDFAGCFVREVATSHWHMCDCLRVQG